MPYVERPRVDYDQLAEKYDARYAVRPLEGIASALRDLVARWQPHRVLEIGCGTGRWLEEIGSRVGLIYGADPSLEMLHQASRRTGSPLLLAARANALPVRRGSFDLIFCVNALHHFDDPQAFVGHAKECLVKTGVLAIVGIDPRLIHKWYLYEYFEGSYERDLLRYPSVGEIVKWMATAGFGGIDIRVVEVSSRSLTGRSVLADPFLNKESNSLLALLSDEEYAAGLRRIEDAVDCAEAEEREIVFQAKLPFVMITGSGGS
jgi:ubiquinone/menaquinone biosynthesis C-methylase UbiE